MYASTFSVWPMRGSLGYYTPYKFTFDGHTENYLNIKFVKPYLLGLMVSLDGVVSTPLPHRPSNHTIKSGSYPFFGKHLNTHFLMDGIMLKIVMIFIAIFMLIATIISVRAETENNLLTFQNNTAPELKVLCSDINGNPCNSATTCSLTVNYPNNSLIVENVAMGYLSNGTFNYTLPVLTVVGDYNVAVAKCSDVTQKYNDSVPINFRIVDTLQSSFLSQFKVSMTKKLDHLTSFLSEVPILVTDSFSSLFNKGDTKSDLPLEAPEPIPGMGVVESETGDSPINKPLLISALAVIGATGYSLHRKGRSERRHKLYEEVLQSHIKSL